MRTPPTLCLYHENCPDGFGSAWAVYRACSNLGWKQPEYAQVNHGSPPPPCDGEDVIIVDFCYDMETTVAMADSASSVTVIDHHEDPNEKIRPLLDSAAIDGVFDPSRSGATLTWEWFFGCDPPKLLQYVEDRDLWRFKMHASKSINAAIMSYPQDFDVWDELFIDLLYEATTTKLEWEGESILRYVEDSINETIERSYYAMIAGHMVPVAVANQNVCEVLNELSKSNPFAAVYSLTGRGAGVYFSLRSAEGGIDVAEVAREYGGNGHKHAAAFLLSIEEFAKWVS